MNTVVPVLVAGGRSRRFGRDKRLAMFGEKRLWDHAMDRLLALGGGWVLVEPGCPLPVPEGAKKMEDPEPHAGPVVALARAVERTGWDGGVVVFPVDMPLLPIAFLQNLLQEAQRKDIRARVVDPDHPLPLALTSPGVVALVEAVRDGERSFRGFLRRLAPDEVALMPDVPPSWLYNVNHPEDLPGEDR